MVTECSMATTSPSSRPDTEFVRPCILCPHMKRITLAKIRDPWCTCVTRWWSSRPSPTGARLRGERMLAVGPSPSRPSLRRAVIVGSGIAGLSTALALRRLRWWSPRRRWARGRSRWAQGGVAAAIAADDDPPLHAADTLAAAAGLADPVVAELLTGAAPERLALADRQRRRVRPRRRRRADARPRGRALPPPHRPRQRRRHRRRDGARPAHRGARPPRHRGARGDLRRRPAPLGRHRGRGLGAHRSRRRTSRILGAGAWCSPPAASAGSTPTPPTPRRSTGDGLAMAARAGARLADLEFVQFHPTALRSTARPDAAAHRGAARRGRRAGRRAGRALHGRRSTPTPSWRRATSWRGPSGGGSTPARTARPRRHPTSGRRFPERFPTVFGYAVQAGIDPRVEPMPVSPAAHYHMGGVAVDGAGRSSLPGL